MDIIDRASKLEQQQRDDLLRRVRNDNNHTISLKHCSECGRTIPKKRREAVKNCTRYIDCQTAMESK